MKILFIGPLPPPMNGHSLACQVFHQSIITSNYVETVDLVKQGMTDGVISFNRLFEIIRVFYEVFKKKTDCDLVYLTISQSLAGNIKDLVIYCICYNQLSKIYIHLHGGSLKKLLFDRHPLLFKINKKFLSRLGGVIISGESHLEIFQNYIDPNKIHIVPNFAKNEMFLTESCIKKKFEKLDPIRLLFLSNMVPLKGYMLLLKAFLDLEERVSSNFFLNFAGRFDTESERKIFESQINGNAQIRYLGVISDEQKIDLVKSSHIFILPTMFFEGQPVSILEAFAAGCFVITTGQSGILDIFTDFENGFQIEPNSEQSLKLSLQWVSENKSKLADIAISNQKKAMKEYRVDTFNSRLKSIMGIV
jgi:glycosyltransferase involved in cell wall biosynthesis